MKGKAIFSSKFVDKHQYCVPLIIDFFFKTLIIIRLSQKENAVAIKENGCSYQRKCRFSHEEH
jgi:hypothetical protein